MAGVYNFTVTAAESGCSATGSTSVVVNTLSIVAGSDAPACVGGAINLNSSVFGTAVPTTYLWSGPLVYTASIQDPALTASATTAMAGVYTVTVNANGSGCSATATTNVVVNTFGLTAGNDGPACVGGTVNLSATPGGSLTPAGYLWNGPI